MSEDVSNETTVLVIALRDAVVKDDMLEISLCCAPTFLIGNLVLWKYLDLIKEKNCNTPFSVPKRKKPYENNFMIIMSVPTCLCQQVSGI